MIDEYLYLIDEYAPPDDGPVQAGDIRAAETAAAFAFTRAIKAGLKRGRFVEIDGMIVLNDTEKTR